MQRSDERGDADAVLRHADTRELSILSTNATNDGVSVDGGDVSVSLSLDANLVTDVHRSSVRLETQIADPCFGILAWRQGMLIDARNTDRRPSVRWYGARVGQLNLLVADPRLVLAPYQRCARVAPCEGIPFL